MTSDTFEMTQRERATLVQDLRVAATCFDEDAARAITAGMAETWRRQAAEAREIADRLEDARYIRVGREASVLHVIFDEDSRFFLRCR